MLKELNELTVGEFVTTIDKTDAQGQIDLYNLQKGNALKLTEIGDVIYPKNFVITAYYDSKDDKNYYRLMLIDNQENKYTATSNGIIRDLCKLYDIFGQNIVSGSIGIKIHKKQLQKGYTYEIEVV